jgi:DNA transformation protein
MTVSSGFSDMLIDVLGPLGRVSVRRMFSGAGVYRDGVMFGLVSDDVLFLKADAASKGAFEAEGADSGDGGQ